MVCKLRLEERAIDPMPSDPYQAAVITHCREVVQQEIQWLSQQLHRERTNLSSKNSTSIEIETKIISSSLE
jgi:hypothetical protein